MYYFIIKNILLLIIIMNIISFIFKHINQQMNKWVNEWIQSFYKNYSLKADETKRPLKKGNPPKNPTNHTRALSFTYTKPTNQIRFSANGYFLFSAMDQSASLHSLPMGELQLKPRLRQEEWDARL